jgi:hypothetical protein
MVGEYPHALEHLDRLEVLMLPGGALLQGIANGLRLVAVDEQLQAYE